MRVRIAAFLLVVAAAGCGTARHRLAGREAEAAAAFFAAAGAVALPAAASFSGVADFRGGAFPLVAGVRDRGDGSESGGLYDPLGRPVLLVENDGKGLTVSRGPAAVEAFPEALSRVSARPFFVETGPVSLMRILSGAPGFPVAAGGEAWRGPDGGWVFDDGIQKLYSDPSRRLISRAEYAVQGKRIRVAYPGRESPGPPRLVTVEVPGGTITLRRDDE